MRKLTGNDMTNIAGSTVQEKSGRDLLQQFKVTITEKLQKIVIIEAETSEEAEQMISDDWKASKYILGSEDFVGVEFESVPMDD